MRRSRPDNRPSWRDPDLPVYGFSGRAIIPEKQVIASTIRMLECGDPDWRDDPTYDLRRKK